MGYRVVNSFKAGRPRFISGQKRGLVHIGVCAQDVVGLTKREIPLT